MLALGPLVGKVSGKGGAPAADILVSVIECVAQMAGTTLFYVRIAVFELPGLVGRGRHPSIGQQLVGGIKTGEVPNLSQDHSAHTVSKPWNGGNGRTHLIHDGLNRGLDFLNLSVQFPDKADGML